MVLPRAYKAFTDGTWCNISSPYYGCTLVHELCHYVFGLYEEYAEWPYWPYQSLGDNSVMNTNWYFMSYRKLYADLGYPHTQQWAKTRKSCWEWFVVIQGCEREILSFAESARYHDGRHYIPYASFTFPPIDINKNFSEQCRNNPSSTFDKIFSRFPPTFDVTQKMNFEVIG
ncbi:MAG: hypothetical protein ACP5KJ_04185 [Candidatus Micrarchaeia archaeon]